MDFFRVLGVSQSASQDEVKQAFRKLALTYHPDRHTHASEAQKKEAASKFKAITEAYETLSDESKRASLRQKTASTSTGTTARRGEGHSYTASSTSSANRARYAGVNTDWSKSYYDHKRHQQWERAQQQAGYARATFWQEFKRYMRYRKTEVLLMSTVGFLFLTSPIIADYIWSVKNRGGLEDYGDDTIPRNRKRNLYPRDRHLFQEEVTKQ